MKKLALACISSCAALATLQPPNPALSKFEINQFDILQFTTANLYQPFYPNKPKKQPPAFQPS